MRLLRTLGKLSVPFHLLLIALTYILGAVIAKYLGYQLRDRVLILGLVVALLLQLAMSWLAAAFRPLHQSFLEDQSPEESIQLRKTALYLAIGALATAAVLAFVLLRLEGAPLEAAVCLGLSIGLILLHAVPPMRGADRGFGELLIAVQIAYLVPTLGFLLQAGTLHRLLSLCALALAVLLVATFIVLGLPSYAGDVRRGRTTMLTQMGWERGLWVHNALLVTAYMLFGVAIPLGFSFGLIGPAFLTLPFALLQVWLLRGIVGGAKPIWSLLQANALAIFALTAYFLTLSFWLH